MRLWGRRKRKLRGMSLQVVGCPLVAGPRAGGGVRAGPPAQGGPCPHSLLLQRHKHGLGPGLRTRSPLVLRAAGQGRLPEPLPAPWGGGQGSVLLAWLQQGPARPGGPFGTWVAGGGAGVRGQRSPANARAAKLSTPQAPRGWRGLPSRAKPWVPVSQNHSETAGQMNPLSEVPRDGGGRRGETAASGPAAPPREA